VQYAAKAAQVPEAFAELTAADLPDTYGIDFEHIDVWLAQHRFVVLHGKPLTGKSRLAATILLHCIGLRWSALPEQIPYLFWFVNTARVASDVLHAERGDDAARNSLYDTRVIVLDAADEVTDGFGLLNSVLRARNDNKLPTIVTVGGKMTTFVERCSDSVQARMLDGKMILCTR
jgi:DNA replication protein DnaC